MICVTIHLLAKPGRESDVESLFREYLPRVNAEPGLDFALHRSRTDTRRFLLYELYPDDATYDAHRASDLFGSFRPRIAELEQSREREIFDTRVSRAGVAEVRP